MAQIYSFEDKLKAVLQCKEGYTPWMVEEETGIDHHTIQDWINRYNQLGEAGLQRKVYNRITFEEKCAIIRKYQKKSCTFARDLCAVQCFEGECKAVDSKW